MTRAALVALMFSLVACSHASHRKPAGPPPEYEPPETLDASTPSMPRPPVDAGSQ